MIKNICQKINGRPCKTNFKVNSKVTANIEPIMEEHRKRNDLLILESRTANSNTVNVPKFWATIIISDNQSSMQD